jgi:preprotein translocase subunit YajC
VSTLLLESTTATSGAGAGASILTIIVYLVFLFGIMYLLVIRPQKKQKQQMDDLHKGMEPGDNIMTTGGFYGTILDIPDDTTVIVEFGNNKNCRIPMHKNAIAEVEKAGSAIVKDDEPEETKEEKKEDKKDKKSK